MEIFASHKIHLFSIGTSTSLIPSSLAPDVPGAKYILNYLGDDESRFSKAKAEMVKCKLIPGFSIPLPGGIRVPQDSLCEDDRGVYKFADGLWRRLDADELMPVYDEKYFILDEIVRMFSEAYMSWGCQIVELLQLDMSNPEYSVFHAISMAQAISLPRPPKRQSKTSPVTVIPYPCDTSKLVKVFRDFSSADLYGTPEATKAVKGIQLKIAAKLMQLD